MILYGRQAMKKIYLLFLIAVLMISMTACKKETVILHCDGENCSNTVEVEVKKTKPRMKIG